MDTEPLRAALIRCAGRVQQAGLVQGTNGNLSVRLMPGCGEFLVTPSGMTYNDLRTVDICHLNAELQRVAGDRRPSVESRLHRDIYAAREDVMAIIHTHALYACVLATARQPLPPIEAALAMVGGSVLVADYADTATEALSRHAVRALGQRQAVLLANHGLVTVGETLDAALETSQVVETAAQKYLLARTLGDVYEIPASSLERIRRFKQQAYGQPSPDES